MAINIERLLRLAADYHAFCDDTPTVSAESDPDLLSESDLELIAAAAYQPSADPADPATVQPPSHF